MAQLLSRGICLKIFKPTYYRDICTSAFISPLIGIAKSWTQPRQLLTEIGMESYMYATDLFFSCKD